MMEGGRKKRRVREEADGGWGARRHKNH